MLISYRINIGAATVIMVIRSAEGVMIAARTKIMTMAYLLLAFKNAGVINPNFDKIKINMGRRNTKPQPMLKVAIVDK